MKIKDLLRTLFGIRKSRQLPPLGAQPPIGSNIVREKLRVRLKYPVTPEQWNWLLRMGWRTIDMRDNRRRYTNVPDKFLMKFIKSSIAEREVLHDKLINARRRIKDNSSK